MQKVTAGTRFRNPFRFLLGNPVVLKELRGRMRGPRAFIVLTGYLIVVGGFTTLFYLSTTSSSLNIDNQFDGGEVGRSLFRAVVAMELFMIAFITPAFTAGAISGERERQTYDLLRTTLLPESKLVIGKLFASLAYIFLLLLAAIPLQSIAFLFGGVDLPEILISLVVLLATSILLGTVGVYFSILRRRTLRANMMTYVVAMGFIAVNTLIVVTLSAISSAFTSDVNTIQWAVLLTLGIFICLNPVATLTVSQDYLVNQQTVFSFVYTFPDGTTTTFPAVWIIFSLLYVLWSYLFFRLSVRLLRKVDDQ